MDVGWGLLTVRAVVVAGQDVGLLGAETVPVGGIAGRELGLGAAEAGVDDTKSGVNRCLQTSKCVQRIRVQVNLGATARSSSRAGRRAGRSGSRGGRLSGSEAGGGQDEGGGVLHSCYASNGY